MAYVVFAQGEEPRVPVNDVLAKARVAEGIRIRVAEGPSSPGDITLDVSFEDASGTFRVMARPVEAADVAAARGAELRGRAAGMGDLAARCRTVWVVEPSPAVPEWLALELCAVLAFTGLGPILPPDRSTLLGVNGARARAERLRAG